MAKANLTLPDGTTVKIEGTVDEVAIILAKFTGGEPKAIPANKRKGKRKVTKKKAGESSTKKNPRQPSTRHRS